MNLCLSGSISESDEGYEGSVSAFLSCEFVCELGSG